jgi:hypothetical protein
VVSWVVFSFFSGLYFVTKLQCSTASLKAWSQVSNTTVF